MIRLCAFADEYADSLDEQIEGLKLNGIDLIELRTVGGKNVVDFTDEEAQEIYRKLSSCGISVWSVGSPIGKVDIDCDYQEYEEKIRRVLRTANILHADKIRAFSFFNTDGKRDKVVKYLQRTVELGKEYGVKICHENEKEIYGDTVEKVVDLMDSVEGLYHVFDPANFLQCGQDGKLAIDTLIDRIEYFHIKDVEKSTGNIVPAGYGDGEIPYLIKRLSGKDVVLTLEPHLFMFSGYAAIDNTEMKSKFTFKDNKESFTFAVQSLKKLL